MELPISLEDFERESGLEGERAVTEWQVLMDAYRRIIRERDEEPPNRFAPEYRVDL